MKKGKDEYKTLYTQLKSANQSNSRKNKNPKK